jgi:hypothetical protein
VDPRLKDLVGRTNLDELIKPAAPQIDYNQPVETAQPAKPDPVRSTVDPFQINFASADIAGKLQDPHTGKGVKAFALVFLGGPLMLFGLGLVYMALAGSTAGLFGRLFAILMGLGMAGFWPYVIFANRRKRAGQLSR